MPLRPYLEIALLQRHLVRPLLFFHRRIQFSPQLFADATCPCRALATHVRHTAVKHLRRPSPSHVRPWAMAWCNITSASVVTWVKSAAVAKLVSHKCNSRGSLPRRGVTYV
eukprot:476923-Prorocentrum_minimum.AAC.1